MIKMSIISIAWFLIVLSPSYATNKKDYKPSTFIVKDIVALGNYFLGKIGNQGGESTVYQQIKKEFQDDYQQIGAELIKKLDEGKPISTNVGLNSVGINYSKGFADFSVELRREIAPDLFDDKRYIIVDHFHIHIEAKKLLHNLQDANIISITQHQIKAFKGIIFKRSYRYVHFADSFKEALHTDLHKLFLGFNLFQGDHYLDLEPYEFISKEDSMTIKIGGLISSGANGIGGQAAQMMKFYRISKVDIQSIGEDDKASPGERVRISFTKEKGKGMLGHLAVHIDFLQLVKIGLFNYDLSYNYLDSYQTNLSFEEQDLTGLQTPEDPLYKAVEKVLQMGAGNLNILGPYTVSKERRQEEVKRSKYFLLLTGSLRECRTAHFQIAKEGKIKSFFRHTYTKIKYEETFFSKIFSTIGAFFKFNVQKQRSEEKGVCIEYQSERNLLKEKGNLIFDDQKEEMLSLSFKKNYFSYKNDKKSQKHCRKILKDCPGVDQKIIDSVDSKKLARDVKLKTTFIMNNEAINHLNSLNLIQVYGALQKVCDAYKDTQKRFCKQQLYNAYDHYFKELITDNYSPQTYLQCIKTIGNSSKKYTYKWVQIMDICMQRISRKKLPMNKCGIPLWRLKNFAKTLHRYTNKERDMYALFGAENIFFYGSLEGQSKIGEKMNTCFSDGEFSGTGPIDNYKRKEKIRSPAAIFLDK